MNDLQKQLIEAIEASDVLAVERALEDGADANGVLEQFGDRTPVLVLAAEKGELNIVRALLLRGADMYARATRERQSMIHDDDTYQEDDGDAIARAIAFKRYDIVEYLLQRGADADQSVAGCLGDPRMLRMLLDRGANPNGPHLGSCVTNHSLKSGNLEGVRLLLEYGADPNSIGWGKKSVMLNAIEFGRLEEAHALLAAGATLPSATEVDKAIADAKLRTEPEFRARAIATARALGFQVE